MFRTCPVRRGDALRICAALICGALAAAALAGSGTDAQRPPTIFTAATSTSLHEPADPSRRPTDLVVGSDLDVGSDLVREDASSDMGAPMPVENFASNLPGSVGIPDVVLVAYRRAEATMGASAPDCRLAWWMLAAIGKMESDHADGGLVDAAGTTHTPIFGPWLDGTNGTAAIPAPGSVAGGPVWERAMGPMQFLPATWATYGDGGDPHNVNDAALAAGRYLCAGGGDLSEPERLAAAVLRYNHSSAYVEAVLAWARTYATGSVLSLPSPGEAGAAANDRPAPGYSSTATRSAAAAAVAFATDQLGLPYVWGGNGPTNGDAGFDCSGLTHAAYIAAGVPTPRTAQTQYNAGPRLRPGAPLELGDLVFYGTPTQVHHVGLYVGADRMIAAPTFGKPVQVSGYRWTGDDFLGASRPAAKPGSLPLVPLSGRARPRTAGPEATPPHALPLAPPLSASSVFTAPTTPTAPQAGPVAAPPAAALTPLAAPLSAPPFPTVTLPPSGMPAIEAPMVSAPTAIPPRVPLPTVPLPTVPSAATAPPAAARPAAPPTAVRPSLATPPQPAPPPTGVASALPFSGESAAEPITMTRAMALELLAFRAAATMTFRDIATGQIVVLTREPGGD